jgi:transglutaminase-like putative cysteine protease
MNNKSCFSQGPRRPGNKRLVQTYGSFALTALIAVAILISSPPAKAGDAPSWMHALVNAPLPKYDDKTDAVLLYSEEILNVQPNGKIKEIDRAAYKILRPDGRRFGKWNFGFTAETRITNIHGWCIPAQGKDYEVKEKDTSERGYIDVEGGELYTDLRAKVMEIPAAEPGNIVGFELERDRRPYILQDEWFFQETEPVAEARYTLQLPPGWEYKAVWLNHAEIQPTPAGNNQWQWEAKDLPAIRWEPDMPPWKGVAGLMIVSIVPPGGAKRGFLSWSDMGNWYTELTQGRREASPEIKQEVAALTAPVPTPLDKMRALADFLQRDIRYVAISLGIGGVQPHPATEVFKHRFGDCKDKATLLSSMLKEIGVDSYYVIINTERGEVTTVTPPHIGGFNHAILAIRLPDGVSDSSLVATVEHPKLGRLLFFDPTDEFTPFGQLRGALQANYGMLVSSDGGELMALPQLATSASGITRTAKLTLDERGNLKGEVHEIRVGDSARYQRMALRSVEKDADRIKPIERLMASSFGAFQVTDARVTNLKQTSLPFEYKWSFVASAYGKTAGNLLLVRPRVIGTKSRDLLERKEPRQYPIENAGPQRDTDMIEITLPAGYEVDDLPPAVNADYSFASYHSKTEVNGNILKYTRTFEVKELSVPLSKVEDLKKLYRIIAGDERNTAVLKPAAH